MATAPTDSTIEVGGRDVIVDDVGQPPWVRSPGDLLRVIVALLGVVLTFAVFDFGKSTFTGLEADVGLAVDSVPKFFVLSTYAVFGVIATLVPLAVAVWVFARRRWRLLGVYFATTITASIAFSLLNGFITDRIPVPVQVSNDLPRWVTESVWSPEWAASFAAALVVSSPWMTRRWRRVAWFVLLMVVPMRMLVGADVPSGLMLGIAGGWFIGSVAILVFGSPQRKPTPYDIAQGLEDSGFPLAELRRAGVDARGSTPYFGVGTDGSGYFVKVLGADERNADLMFRVYRWFRLEHVGDERPFSSLRRAVEHEALVAVMAERCGVVTPSLLSTVELFDGSMALVYAKVGGRSLDKVDPAEVTPDVLRGVWAQVKLLHDHRIAHRDLRRANVFLDDQSRPMLIDFGFGEIAAGPDPLAQDVAQLVISTAVDVGATRAVTDAVAVMGPTAIAAAAPRMQVVALAGATQSALKKQKDLLAEVIEQVKAQTDLQEIEFAKLERVKPRTVLLAALLFGAVWFLIPQLADLPRVLQEIRGANWIWAVPAIIFSMLTYVGAAMALSSSVAQRISVAKTTLVTLGGSFVNRVTPAKVGGVALNMRFLQKQGIETPVAVASVGLYQAVGLMVHLSLLLVFGLWAGKTISITDLLPSGTVIFIVVAVVLTAIGVFVAVPKLRKTFNTVIRPQLGKILANLRGLLQHPVRLIVMVAGSAILTLSYIGALWASIQAFGGGLPIAGIAVVYLAGASIASAAPTPGGIGAVEAALVAGLTALGLASAIAVPAVFLYRLATFWVPVLPGWIGFTVLERRGDI